jgi:hypothetical protein
MTERSFGSTRNDWVGIVTNVNDPHQSGRVQVRVFGQHDDRVNIPDSALPWAQVLQPVTSAALGRAGTAPVGMMVGTRVFGIWLEGDRQYPLIQGTLGRAGAPIPGQTQGGAPAVNTAVGSIPAAAQGSPSNPYTQLANNRIEVATANTSTLETVTRDQGTILTVAVEDGMQFANTPTVGSAEPGEKDPVTLLQQVDPQNLLSSLPCLRPAATEIRINIDLASIAEGFIAMLADALTRAILELMDRLGINAILRAIESAASALANFSDAVNALLSGGICAAPAALNSMAAGTRALARSYANIQQAVNRGDNTTAGIRSSLGLITTAPLSRVPVASFRPISVVTEVPVGYVQEYYGYDNDPYPGYIRWKSIDESGDPVFTLRNGQPNFESAKQHTSFEISALTSAALGSAFQTGTISTSNLENILAQVSGFAQAQALVRTMGSGDPTRILLASARLIPQIYSNITGLFNARFTVSILPSQDAINRSMQRFTQVQTVLAQRRARLEQAFRRI